MNNDPLTPEIFERNNWTKYDIAKGYPNYRITVPAVSNNPGKFELRAFRYDNMDSYTVVYAFNDKDVIVDVNTVRKLKMLYELLKMEFQSE